MKHCDRNENRVEREKVEGIIYVVRRCYHESYTKRLASLPDRAHIFGFTYAKMLQIPAIHLVKHAL